MNAENRRLGCMTNGSPLSHPLLLPTRLSIVDVNDIYPYYLVIRNQQS